MGPEESAEQESTEKPTKTENTRKRKRTQSFENHIYSKSRHDKEIENDIKMLKRDQRVVLHNQQIILDKLEKLTNILDNRTLSLSYPCLKQPTLPGSSVDECIHGDVLQENMKMLVQDMDLSNGLILDELLQNGSLTDNEAQEIGKLSRPDKTRKLATVIGRNNKTKFREFLGLIAEKHFYPHIAKSLGQSYEEKLKAQEKYSKCVRCFIIKKVNIKHILDHLCENRMIDLQEMGNYIKGDNTDQFWCQIFQKMSHPVFGENCVSVFINSLKEHYPHIAKKIGGKHHLTCFCSSAILSYPSGSGGNVSEHSTTTTIIPESQTNEKLNAFLSGVSVGDSSDISISTVIPEPKPETREWVQKHQEIRETESLSENCSSIQSHAEVIEGETDIPYMCSKLTHISDFKIIHYLKEIIDGYLDDNKLEVEITKTHPKRTDDSQIESDGANHAKKNKERTPSFNSSLGLQYIDHHRPRKVYETES